MLPYQQLSQPELEERLSELRAQYEAFCAQKLALDMSRGKPAPDQFAFAKDLLDVVNSSSDLHAAGNVDTRNYGAFSGIKECKEIFSEMLGGVGDDELFIGGNSSLNLMYDTISRMMQFGLRPGQTPWGQQGKLKFLCPSPGYDRHFAITELFGFELVMVPMTETGPDMDVVEDLVANDASIKGIWCVPKFSNPTGVIYSDETVRRFATMKTAAPDFLIMWDNAYGVHELHPKEVRYAIPNLLEECKKAGDPNRVMMFTSTSKITYAGAGVCAFACSAAMMKRAQQLISIQTIGHDKINQLRHARFLRNFDGILAVMEQHAELVAPKFDAVLDLLEEHLGGKGIAEWTEPDGGYFISLDVMDGCAKRVIQLCKDAGVVLTGAGAAFPYGKDPRDCNIRIAPTYPTVEELQTAMPLLCVCTEMAATEKLLREQINVNISAAAD